MCQTLNIVQNVTQKPHCEETLVVVCVSKKKGPLHLSCVSDSTNAPLKHAYEYKAYTDIIFQVQFEYFSK